MFDLCYYTTSHLNSNRALFYFLTLSTISYMHKESRTVIKRPDECIVTSLQYCLPSKIVHTTGNLHTVSYNPVNRPHNHYWNSYYTQIMSLVRKMKCYRLTQVPII